MPIDRTAEADAEKEPPAVERTPPPDTPGRMEGTSRADSRVGAAAANDTASGQENGEADTDGSESEDPSENPSAEAVEDTSEEPGTAGEIEDPESAHERLETPPAEEENAGTESADTDNAADESLDGADEPAAYERPITDDGEADAAPDIAATSRKNDKPASVPEADDRGRRPEAVATPPRDTPRVEPLTDREYSEHTARVESQVIAAVERGESTDVRHTLDADRTIWHPDRAELHQQIVDDLYSAAADVPNDGQAIVAGGLGGAGKSTTLEDHAGIDRSRYLTINPDDIKESLARRGMIPPVEGLAPMERSALVHEESSEIARSLASRAYADRKNVIWDITMSSRLSTARRLQQLREAGYRHVEGIFVHIPVATSVERAEARHRHGLEDYRNGEGLGGRYVPPEVIRANADETWGSVNRSVFEELKPQFDRWKLYDNSVNGRGPLLLESSDGSERNDDE